MTTTTPPDDRSRTLSVRRVPDDLLRRAKAMAVGQGTTLRGLVIEALEDKVRAATPEPSTRDPFEGLEAEIAWYEANRDELAERYDGEYIAVLDGQVVDHDADFGPLARRTFDQHGPRSVYLPRCQQGERRVRLRSPRRVSP